MSKTPLTKGSLITLECKNSITDTEYTETFTVLGVRGKGGSSFVYEVRSRNGNVCVLKEFFPTYINGDINALSREKNNIVIKSGHEKEFTRLLNKFENTYNLINNYLKCNVNAGLQNVSYISMCKGNNTCYTQMAYDSGISYDKIEDEDVNFIFRIALATAKAVRQFHRAGYLLMDIKPANILVLQNGDEYVTDIVKLFDFDSVTDKDEAEDTRGFLELTPGFAPPETGNNKKYRINESSDIYEIGAMVRNRLTMKSPVSADARHFSAGKIELDDKFKGTVSPAVMNLIRNFLFKTMNINQEERYKNIDEVIKKLRELVEKTRPGRIYLRDKIKSPSVKSAGRKNNTEEIEEMISKHKAVFIRSSLTKERTELALEFAQKYKDKYSTIQFISFNTSLRKTITSLDFVNFNDEEFKNSEKLLKAKLDLLENCDSGTLIIIDGFLDSDDDLLDHLIMNRNSKVRYLFTTECEIERYPDNIYNVETLFDSHSNDEENNVSEWIEFL